MLLKKGFGLETEIILQSMIAQLKIFMGLEGRSRLGRHVNGSYGVYVYSTEVTASPDWWDFIATDGSLNKTGWPTNPVDNFQFYNNTMDDCGDGDDYCVIS
jgi:hypothetical protein